MKTVKEILEQISETGSCGTLNAQSCTICPMSRLKRREDDSGWLSCVEAIGHKSFNDIDERYKLIAREILLDLAISKELEDED